MYKEIRLAGTGGQGLILAGLILAEAAGIYDGYNVIQTQSYGPEARGGASKTEVIISSMPIDYPKVTLPDILLIMSQQSWDKYASWVKPETIILVDKSNVTSMSIFERPMIVSLPITEMAKDKVGKGVVANVVALGVLVGVTGVVTHLSMEKAILSRVPRGTERLNMDAFGVGLKSVKGVRAFYEIT